MLRPIWLAMNPFTKIRSRFAFLRQNPLESEIARLRDEISRLRAENRALLNSILGIAGIPPLPPMLTTTSFTTGVPSDAAFARWGGTTPPAPAGHSESTPPSRAADTPLSTPTSSDPPTAVASEAPQRQSRTRNDSSISSSRSSPHVLHAPPHRRRSWHQINRILELQSLRNANDPPLTNH